MQAHAFTIFRVEKKFYHMTSNERAAALDAIAAKAKAKIAENQWDEGQSHAPCDWPDWLIAIIEGMSPRFKWDTLNGEYKIAYGSEQEADKAASEFKARLEAYVGDPEHAAEKEWYLKEKLILRVRPLTNEALDLDEELRDSVEEAHRE